MARSAATDRQFLELHNGKWRVSVAVPRGLQASQPHGAVRGSNPEFSPRLVQGVARRSGPARRDCSSPSQRAERLAFEFREPTGSARGTCARARMADRAGDHRPRRAADGGWRDLPRHQDHSFLFRGRGKPENGQAWRHMKARARPSSTIAVATGWARPDRQVERLVL